MLNIDDPVIVCKLSVLDCEPDTANRYESYRKGHRNGKRKLMKVYLYTTQLALTSKDDKKQQH